MSGLVDNAGAHRSNCVACNLRHPCSIIGLSDVFHIYNRLQGRARCATVAVAPNPDEAQLRLTQAHDNNDLMDNS